MNIHTTARATLLGLSVFLAAAAAPPSNAVPATPPADTATAQQDQSAARKLLRADKHVRGRIHHDPGYAARQSADIHKQREEYLRNKALSTQ